MLDVALTKNKANNEKKRLIFDLQKVRTVESEVYMVLFLYRVGVKPVNLLNERLK